MDKFWDAVIEPLLDAASAATVVEIGVDRGEATSLLLDRAERTGRGVVHAIDPAPELDVGEWRSRYGSRLRFHLKRSHDALAHIGQVDAALIDGDHNWFTVNGELRRLARAAADSSTPLPLCLIHDVGWPYGRRDMYYELDSVPADERQPAERIGVLPGHSELRPEGMNPSLWNATRCGGPRNGVLTAVEDFVAWYEAPCELVVIERFFGLGVLASTARLETSSRLRDALAHLNSLEFYRGWAATLEQARMDAVIRAWWGAGQPDRAAR